MPHPHSYTFLIATLFTVLLGDALASPSQHLVGWSNFFVPGAGRLLLGEPWRAGGEAALSLGTLGVGYAISKPGPWTLDGVPNDLPTFGRNGRRGTSEANVAKELHSEILQEIGIKSHMSFVYLSYRDAARERGITDHIDQSPVNELFLAPFKTDYFKDALVVIPIAVTAIAAVIDFQIAKADGLPLVPRLTPYSNFLYSLDYQIVQPIGSGAPEEMFYRGFIQNELRSIVDSPWFAIPLSSAAFAFSHGPGYGRISAAVAGAYLGYLAHRGNGDLKPGIVVHFWSSLILGIETVLLSHEAQATTPPAALSFQINY